MKNIDFEGLVKRFTSSLAKCFCCMSITSLNRLAKAPFSFFSCYPSNRNRLTLFLKMMQQQFCELFTSCHLTNFRFPKYTTKKDATLYVNCSNKCRTRSFFHVTFPFRNYTEYPREINHHTSFPCNAFLV